MVKTNKAAELNALWVNPSFSGKKSALLWIRMLFEMLSCRKSQFLYTYSLKSASLGAIYAVVRPTVIYRGLTKTVPGMKQPDEESVEYFQLKNIFLALFRDPTWLFRKRRGHKYREKVFTRTEDAYQGN